MKASYKIEKGLLKLKFTPHINDGVDCSGKIKMGRYDCNIHIPEDWDIEKIHPDVFALIIALIVYPFTNEIIEVPIGVSQEFHDLFKEETKKLIYPVDKSLKPRRAPKDAIPGLAYSGGVDSTAALTLLPESTACFFLDRILPPDAGKDLKLHDKRSIYSTYKQLEEIGIQGYMIKTDLEYVRMPRGFPVEYASTIPALLLSDYVGLDSIATGTIMEHQFIPYHKISIDRDYFVKWRNLFKCVDLSLNQVTTGISEVGTMKIVLNSPYHLFTHWCLKENSSPCYKCEKCFRKVLLKAILLEQEITDDMLDKFFLSPEVRTTIRQLPIPCENVIAYITSHYKGRHNFMHILKKRVRGDVLETSWMEKWYSPSESLMAEKYSSYIKSKIAKYLETMNQDDEKNMGYWDIFKIKESPLYIKYQKEFVSELIKFKQNFKSQ